MKKLPALGATCFAFIFLFACLRANAQKKVTLDVNLGTVQSIAKNLRSTYVSEENIQIDHYRRLKFESSYLKVIVNPRYALNSRF
ncbi:MAG TPA: hypothetical protein VF609_16570 [Flavisolibacter sp.]|jgi:3-deoxy-D-manno-octulosonic-acid transferase